MPSEIIDLEADLQGQLAPVMAELIDRLDEGLTIPQQAAIGAALVKAASAGSRIIVGILAFELEKFGVSIDVEALAIQGVDVYAEMFDSDDQIADG